MLPISGRDRYAEGSPGFLHAAGASAAGSGGGPHGAPSSVPSVHGASRTAIQVTLVPTIVRRAASSNVGPDGSWEPFVLPVDPSPNSRQNKKRGAEMGGEQQLERSVLEAKEREELQAIADALSLKP